MTKYLLILIFITSSLYSQPEPELLNKAYKQNSFLLLEDFLKKWQTTFPTITDDVLQIQTDTVKSVYGIFEDLYRPGNMVSITESTFSKYDSLYRNVSYAIVQNKIHFCFLDHFNSDDFLTDKDYAQRWPSDDTVQTLKFLYSLFEGYEKKTPYDSVMNFRPRISSDTLKPLYLDFNYKSAIRRYIFGLQGKSGLSSRDTEKRADLLRKYFYVQSTYVADWKLNTYPYITEIDFTFDMKRARATYFIDGAMWRAYYELTDGKWIQIKHIFAGWWD